jgi:hypothetical protein
MTTKWLVFPAPAPADAVAITLANDAAGFYTGVPPKWAALSEEQAWSLPCVLVVSEDDVVVSWTPA